PPDEAKMCRAADCSLRQCGKSCPGARLGIGMEWFKAASQLVGTLIWPGVVLTIVLIFRRELRGIVGAIKEVKYPGGSITLEVARLEERIGKSPLLGGPAPAVE